VASNTASVQSELTWASRLGASSPRAAGFPGSSAPIATRGTGSCAVVVHAVPPVPVKAAFAAKQAPADVVATLLGQTNTHNYMTRAYATGEGASGPPPEPPKRRPV
jgi:hypothetical protein